MAGGSRERELATTRVQCGCAKRWVTKFHLNHVSITQLITVASVSRMTVKLCDQCIVVAAAAHGTQHTPATQQQIQPRWNAEKKLTKVAQTTPQQSRRTHHRAPRQSGVASRSQPGKQEKQLSQHSSSSGPQIASQHASQQRQQSSSSIPSLSVSLSLCLSVSRSLSLCVCVCVFLCVFLCVFSPEAVVVPLRL